MLNLTRKEQEDVIIDGNIVVRVLKIQRGRVVLGIEAPSGVNIARGELVEGSHN